MWEVHTLYLLYLCMSVYCTYSRDLFNNGYAMRRMEPVWLPRVCPRWILDKENKGGMVWYGMIWYDMVWLVWYGKEEEEEVEVKSVDCLKVCR